MQLFQGEKPAHDFLSLHTGGGSSSPVQHSTQVAGYDLGVHTSLKPLKLGKRRGRAIGMAASGLEADSEERVLPGGVGTFSIRQAPSTTEPRGQPASQGVVVRGAFAPGLHGSRTEGTHGAESGARAHSGPATMWQDSGADQRSRGTRGEGRSSGSSADQGPNTPRSKHSATEQRRRTKINDRLEILRELLPHGDQKRDKASFLLEVIEYIRFLQEKVQKYESAHPQKNHEDSSMPWAKVYYRSCWKNTENTSQVQGGGLSAPTQDMNNERYCSKQSTVAPTALFSTQSAGETSIDDISSPKATSTPQNWADDSTPGKQPPWLSMSTSDSGNRTLSKNEKQTLHEDARNLSNAYSQGLLDRLTQALKRSGVDPSQASISVEINMDKRATEPSNMHGNLKDNECEETIHVAKKLRC
ncbi:unnamed protein product [Urochloa decumbens]|uniref:BHLH domain-containing protein n=1 Tax=Urochloa decumbens TaxID=240449 RepID=A0ABC8V6T6_9POAL